MAVIAGMTRREFLDCCERCEREYGDLFPLGALAQDAPVETLFDPLTSTCFVVLEEGLVTIPTTQALDVASQTPLLLRPQDYVSDMPAEAQLHVERSVRAAAVHLLQLAKLADRLGS